MRGRDGEATSGGGLVFVEAEVRALPDARKERAELAIGRRGVDDVRSEDDQRVDLATLERRDERAEVVARVTGGGDGRQCHREVAAERRVQRMGERVDQRR